MENDIRYALQEDNGYIVNPRRGQRKTKDKRLDRKLFNGLDSPCTRDRDNGCRQEKIHERDGGK